jgi:hypothetical protein
MNGEKASGHSMKDRSLIEEIHFARRKIPVPADETLLEERMQSKITDNLLDFIHSFTKENDPAKCGSSNCPR